MPKYLVKASYTAQGAKGVAKDGGSSRRDAVKTAAASVGGTLESFYFAFGDVDAYVVFDVPNNETAAAIAMSVNASGGATVETIVLLTPEEVDAAAQTHVDFRPAGG